MNSPFFHLNYAVGADLSFLKMAEENGTEFKENEAVKPGLDIFSDHGYDWIRLRLFHSPEKPKIIWSTPLIRSNGAAKLIHVIESENEPIARLSRSLPG